MSALACSTATAVAAPVATWMAELEVVLAVIPLVAAPVAPVDALLLVALPLVTLPPVTLLLVDEPLVAALLGEEPDPGETKEPPERPPEGTLAFAFIAFALNVAKLLPPLGLRGYS